MKPRQHFQLAVAAKRQEIANCAKLKNAIRRIFAAFPMNRSAGILPAYDGRLPAMAKSKKSTHRNPNPQSRRNAGAPVRGEGARRVVNFLTMK